MIAPITISPSLILKSLFFTLASNGTFRLVFSLNALSKSLEALVNKTLSCGRLGPEILGTTEFRSKDIVSVNSIFSF